VRHVVQLRRSFLAWCFAEGIITEDLVEASPDIRQAVSRPLPGSEAIGVDDQPHPRPITAAATSSALTGGGAVSGAGDGQQGPGQGQSKNKDLLLFRVLDEFESFEEKQLTELRRELGVLLPANPSSSSSNPSNSNGGTRSRGTSNAVPPAVVPGQPFGPAVYLGGAAYQRSLSDFDWVNELADTIATIRAEVSLIKEVIE
jgi:hypothetical protein